MLVVLGGLAALVLAALVSEYGVVLVLGGLVLGAAAVVMLLQPQVATLLTIFLLYINAPAVLTQQHGLPELVAGAFILLLGVPILNTVIARRERLRFDATCVLMLGFLGTLGLSALGAVDKGIAVARVQGYVFEGLLLYWLIINVIRDLTTLRRTIWTLLAAASLVSALCLYQDITGDYGQEFGGLAYRNYDVARDGYVGAARDKRGKFDRAQGPVNEPNRFAQILIVLLPFAVYLHRTTRAPAPRLAAAAAGLMTLAGIVLTLSRGAIIALLVMAATMMWLRWVKSSRLALLAAGLLMAAPLFAPFYLDRVTSLTNVTNLLSTQPQQYRQTDGAMRGRMTEMLAALYVFFDHPLVGVGPGQFAPFYVQQYSRNPDIKFRDIDEPRRAHTLYFELAAEVGLLGLGAFLTIVGVLVRQLWRARREWLPVRPADADLATACVLSLLAYLWTGIFLHMSYQRYYWFLLALTSAALHIGRARHRTAEAAS